MKKLTLVLFVLLSCLFLVVSTFGGDGKGHYVYDQNWEVAGCIEPGSHCSYGGLAK
jgi:hypothetical protein